MGSEICVALISDTAAYAVGEKVVKSRQATPNATARDFIRVLLHLLFRHG